MLREIFLFPCYIIVSGTHMICNYLRKLISDLRNPAVSPEGHVHTIAELSHRAAEYELIMAEKAKHKPDRPSLPAQNACSNQPRNRQKPSPANASIEGTRNSHQPACKYI